MLYELRGESRIEMEALAERVVAREADADDTRLPEERVNRAVVALHHRTLPSLDDAGLVEFDARQGDVVPSQDFASVEKYLELAERDDRE
ncbi:hypothetical protein [Halovivax sp.]|uniref:DUF7344 domain-containing protein n=1 Tax=Halovivax sp. TaxID=1935978 RepID=UPI0025C6E47A|nr:hypothetical protein [Halovivax sp.]